MEGAVEGVRGRELGSRVMVYRVVRKEENSRDNRKQLFSGRVIRL